LEHNQLACKNCAGSSETRDQTAIFLPEPVQIVSAEHKSNPLGAEYEMILREGKKFVLNIGAGATAARYTNCVEFEHKIFRNTDVVGDAHCLPFRNEIFDCVFAFNVFEHLENPRRAAAEILRVSKKGGSLFIHTFPATAPRRAVSFLQRDRIWRALLVQRVRCGKMPREPKL
jgi:SAM-dependent methyltransferase